MINFLKRLFGKKEKFSLEVPIEFLQADPPDWLLELKVKSMPCSDAFAVRVRLQTETRTGSATIEFQPAPGGVAPQPAMADLTAIEAGRLLVLLGFSFPNDITNVGAPAMDGIPAMLSAHQREPYRLKEGNCNLMSWLDSKKSPPPTIEIALLLLNVKERLFPKK